MAEAFGIFVFMGIVAFIFVLPAAASLYAVRNRPRWQQWLIVPACTWAWIVGWAVVFSIITHDSHPIG